MVCCCGRCRLSRSVSGFAFRAAVVSAALPPAILTLQEVSGQAASAPDHRELRKALATSQHDTEQTEPGSGCQKLDSTGAVSTLRMNEIDAALMLHCLRQHVLGSIVAYPVVEHRLSLGRGRSVACNLQITSSPLGKGICTVSNIKHIGSHASMTVPEQKQLMLGRPHLKGAKSSGAPSADTCTPGQHNARHFCRERGSSSRSSVAQC